MTGGQLYRDGAIAPSMRLASSLFIFQVWHLCTNIGHIVFIYFLDLVQITGLSFSSINPSYIYIQGVDYEVHICCLCLFCFSLIVSLIDKTKYSLHLCTHRISGCHLYPCKPTYMPYIVKS